MSILERFIRQYFESEDTSKIKFVDQMTDKWKDKLQDFDNLLVQRYGKTLLYHTFFRKINLRSLCGSAKTIEKKHIVEQVGHFYTLSEEDIEILLIPFQKKDKINKSLYLSLFEFSFTPMCIITASFNNSPTFEKYFSVLLKQTYVMFRVIYVDDASTDGTFYNINEFLKGKKERPKISLLQNTENMKQAFTKHRAYSLADSDEVLVFIDGDDWLSSKNSLHMVNQAYMKYPENKITCGSFATYFEGNISGKTDLKDTLDCSLVPVKNCRKDKQWNYSHLRTGRAHLFQNIPPRYIQDEDGEWLDRCTDVAEMYWALDQCSHYVKIHNVLLHYNKDNSIKYPNSFYNEESKIKRDEILHYIKNIKQDIPVDSIYIIHMIKRTKRKKKLEQQLHKYIEQPYTYFDAIDGSANSFDYIFQKYTQESLHSKTNRLSRGALGLIASYCSLLHTVFQSNDESILLLEDDVLFNYDFKNKIKDYHEIIEKYDIVYLGANQQNWEEVRPVDKGYEINPGFFKWTYGTFAVILKRHVFEKLYIELCSKPVHLHNLPIDCMLNLLAERYNFNVFVCSPNLIIADLSESDISESRDMKEWSKKLHWDLTEYETVENEEFFYAT